MCRTIGLCKSLLAAMIFATLTVLPVQRASAASMVEYDLLLFLILINMASFAPADLPAGSAIVAGQLQVAAEGARAANISGNRAGEVSRLSKSIGAAEALIGMTAACGDCVELKDTLQQIVGVAASLKTSAVGASATCQPNGVIGPHEQCDPLAVPNGCPVGGVALTYCSDECRCTSP